MSPSRTTATEVKARPHHAQRLDRETGTYYNHYEDFLRVFARDVGTHRGAQREYAERNNMHPSHVSLILNGHNDPPRWLLRQYGYDSCTIVISTQRTPS